MFEAAYAKASKFTKPVVVSTKSVGGECSAAIGSYVVLNSDGWIATAAHIIQLIQQREAEALKTLAELSARKAIQDDAGLTAKEKSKRLAKMPVARNACERWAAWWGADQLRVDQAKFDLSVDLAVAQLINFDPTQITDYPVIKDPTKGINPGRSLCKLGFPFHAISPTWDSAAGAFRFPPDALPFPLFPIDGILTRIVNLDGPPASYPKKLIETSSPGLKGQSGGPTFDVNGTVWAIQSSTKHQPLGFDPEVPGKPHQREHQFMNLGWGVHCATLTGILDELGVAYQKSAY